MVANNAQKFFELQEYVGCGGFLNLNHMFFFVLQKEADVVKRNI